MYSKSSRVALNGARREPAMDGVTVAADCIPLLAKICAGRGGMTTAAFPNNENIHGDGRVELIDRTRIEATPLYNKRPRSRSRSSRRNWTTYNYAALWISMAHCIPTYMLASGLMAAGMNWWQAPDHDPPRQHDRPRPDPAELPPGHAYGIPFPVFARAAYGTLGSNLPALMRALVACGWFGIQAWIGGEALQTLLRGPLPRLAGTLLGAGSLAATRRRSGSRSCSSGASTSSSSTGGWTCCARSRTGRRRSSSS